MVERTSPILQCREGRLRHISSRVSLAGVKIRLPVRSDMDAIAKHLSTPIPDISGYPAQRHHPCAKLAKAARSKLRSKGGHDPARLVVPRSLRG